MEDLKPIFALMYIFLLVIPSLPKYLKYGPTASDMIRDLQHLKRHRNLLGIHSPFCSHKKPISHAIFFHYEHVSLPTSSRKHSRKKGNIQILKALVNICSD